ncbi:hypothetical protein ACFL21_03140 [Patescibacteria group bacterium]
MSKLKKLFIITIGVFLLMSFSGCSDNEKSSSFYYNEDFGFSLILPESIQEYEVESEVPGVASNSIEAIVFVFDGNQLFEVSIFDIENEITVQTIAENNKFAFMVGGITNAITGFHLPESDIEEIEKSFRVYDIE